MKMKSDEEERRARARNRNKGTRTPGDPCALIWAIENLPEELWARGVVCPVERAVMLGATSKRVLALLAGLQQRVPAAVRVIPSASMKSVVGGLRRLPAWCQVVCLARSFSILFSNQNQAGEPSGLARCSFVIVSVLSEKSECRSRRSFILATVPFA